MNDNKAWAQRVLSAIQYQRMLNRMESGLTDVSDDYADVAKELFSDRKKLEHTGLTAAYKKLVEKIETRPSVLLSAIPHACDPVYDTKKDVIGQYQTWDGKMITLTYQEIARRLLENHLEKQKLIGILQGKIPPTVLRQKVDPRVCQNWSYFKKMYEGE